MGEEAGTTSVCGAVATCAIAVKSLTGSYFTPLVKNCTVWCGGPRFISRV
jgi:hypothetical protein